MAERLQFESLHTHTNESDGAASHEEVLKAAEANGFGTVAFTDHDSVLSPDHLKRLRRYDGPVEWISGVEFSSGLPRERGGGTASNVHITGLFVDPTNEDLLEHCQKTHEARDERMQKIVENLQGLGFRISKEDCLEASGGESVGRPHIVQAIMKHEGENQEILDNLKGEMREAAKHDEEIAEKYQEVEADPKQLPYKLFLDGEAFKKGVYVEYSYWQDFDSAVELIRNAGGIAVLAHWWTAAKKIDRELLEQIVRDGRIDGLETSFPLARQTNNTQEDVLQEIAKTHNCPGVTAVDLHELNTFADLAGLPEEAASTTGTTRRLIEATGVSTEWSSLTG